MEQVDQETTERMPIEHVQRVAGVGMSLWIAWNVYFVILSPHEVAARLDVSASLLQFSVVLGFALGSLVVVLLGERRLIKLYRSRMSLVPAGGFLVFGAVFYLAAFYLNDANVLVAGNVFVGITGVMVTLIWMNMVAVIPREELFRLLGWTAALGSAASAVLFFTDSMVVGRLLGFFVLVASLECYRRAHSISIGIDVEGLSHIEVQQRRFVMPKNILLAGALFTVVIGMIAALYARLAALPEVDAMQTGWEAVGMAAASLFFLYLNRRSSTLGRYSTVSLKIVLMLITCGLFLVQIPSFSLPVVSNLVFAGGFILFYLYIKTVYFEIAWRTPALPLEVFAQAFLANYLLSFASGTLMSVLPISLLEQPFLPFSLMVIYLILSVTVLVCFSDKNVSTCWGLISIEGKEKRGEGGFRAVVEEIADKFSLTAREREVLLLLARGYRAAQIEAALTISYGTVRTHINHIYAKLQIHTYAELCKLIEAEKSQQGSKAR